MASKKQIVIVNNVRYRYEDARRLGLISDGKALTSRSENVTEKVTDQGDSAPAETSPDQTATGPVRPARNASRGEWVQYAVANGHPEEDLKDLKRDEISELFQDDPAGDQDQQ